MKLILSLIMFWQCFAYGQITVRPSTNNPVLNESFDLVFNIEVDSDEEPFITFDTYGVDISDKRKEGSSTKTTYFNGKLTVKKEIQYVYEVVPNKAGRITIRDIQVKIGDKTYRHPSVTLLASSQPKYKIPVFVLAIPDKTEVYLGESIMLRYYLYFKYNISNTEIQEFPKLTRFMKRFLQEKSYVEKVNYQNDIYSRTLLYSSVIFPEKTGNLKIDPMRVSVYYPERRNDPFGSFGFGFSKMKKKSISSKIVNVKVLPLPKDNMPQNFTGLVGEHKFNLKINKNKFLVNEPVEIELKISGVGNLENYDAPKILNIDSFEEFESSSNFEIGTDKSATKTFNYTYLAKKNGITPAETIGLSYFDSRTKSYKEVNLKLPQITIAGNNMNYSGIPKKEAVKGMAPDEAIQVERNLMAPIFKSSFFSKKWILWANWCLGFIIISIFASRFYTWNKSQQTKNEFQALLNNIKKRGLSYQTVYPVIKLLEKDQTRNNSINDVIRDSNLTVAAKSYFKNLLTSSEEKMYGQMKEVKKVKFNKTYFKEVEKIVLSDNENTELDSRNQS